MLSNPYYTKNYARIIDTTCLLLEPRRTSEWYVHPSSAQQLVKSTQLAS